MSHFFQRAPVQDTCQKRFLEAILHKKHMVASFPLSYPTVSLYALAAMMGPGMAIVICSSSGPIRQRMEYFRNAGLHFPEVAFLDGSQPPHEERAIQQEINRNRVKLLYTTAQRFATLTFLEIMVHSEVSFLGIEEADRLLPAMPGHWAYKRLVADGLSQLRQMPPLALLTPPISPGRVLELAKVLNLPPLHVLQIPPLIEPVEFQVKSLFTEQQKFQALVRLLSGNPQPGRTGRLDGPGSVLIQAAYPAQAEKLGSALSDYGFDSVWVSHSKKAPRELARTQELTATRLNNIVVNAGLDTRDWMPPAEARGRIVYWSLPAGLDDLLMQSFRQVGEPRPPQVHQSMMLYTKEDYQAAIRRLQTSRQLDIDEIGGRITALRQLRQWVLSESCRLQTLAAFYQGASVVSFPPCGRCDRCLDRPVRHAWVRRLLRKWLF